MTERDRFPGLQAAARLLGSRTGDLALPELRELLCHDCEFWHEEHEEELECSSFRILRILLKKGTLTPAGLAEIVGGWERK